MDPPGAHTSICLSAPLVYSSYEQALQSHSDSEVFSKIQMNSGDLKRFELYLISGIKAASVHAFVVSTKHQCCSTRPHAKSLIIHNCRKESLYNASNGMRKDLIMRI